MNSGAVGAILPASRNDPRAGPEAAGTEVQTVARGDHHGLPDDLQVVRMEADQVLLRELVAAAEEHVLVAGRPLGPRPLCTQPCWPR